MNWRWTARRLVVSAFLVFHLSALLIWLVPGCAIRDRCVGVVSYYLEPTGLWQYWAMFSPNPLGDTLLFEAEVIDAQNLRHGFSFPHLTDYSTWEGIVRYRQSKYAAIMSSAEYETTRDFAARHVLRQLDLPPDAFPVTVRLFYRVRPAPKPGTMSDPMTPMYSHTLATYPFQTAAEARP